MKKATPFFISLTCLLLWQAGAQAAPAYWDSNGNSAGAGNPANSVSGWDVDTFWSTNSPGGVATAVWGDGDAAVFSAGTDAIDPFTVNISANVNASGLTFEEGVATITGGTITMNAVDWPIIANTNAIISATLSDGFLGYGFKKTGTGTVTLSAANSLDGINTVAEGVVVAGNVNALGNASVQTIVSNGATLQVTVTGTCSEALILHDNGFDGAGALRNTIGTATKGGATTLGSNARINLDGGGTWTWSNATGIDGTNAGGIFSVTFGGNGGTYRMNNGFRSIILNNAPLYKDGASVLRFETPCIGVTETYLNGGWIVTRAAGGGQWMGTGKTCYVAAAASGFITANASPDLNMPLELASGANPLFNVVSNTTFTENSVINGLGGLSVTNIGKLILKAANTYSGNTAILGSPTPKPNGGGGTLVLESTGSIASSPVIDVQQNAFFDVALVTGGYVLGAAQTLKGDGTVLGDVTANGTVSPGASIGALSFNNNLTVRKLLIEVNKSVSPSNDVVVVAAAGTLTAGSGTLTVANLDSGAPLAIGDTFYLFKDELGFNRAVTSGSLLTVTGAGATWNNNLATDGSISVASIITAVPATNLTVAVASPGSVILGGMGAASSAYNVYASTNVTLPMTSWWMIGTTNSDPGGAIQFLDSQATNAQRFYRFGQ